MWSGLVWVTVGSLLAPVAGVTVGAARQVVHSEQVLFPTPRRAVETHYSDTAHRTRFTVTVVPHSPKGSDVPVNLVLAAEFSGDQTGAVPVTGRQPETITLLAAASPTFVGGTGVPTVALTGDSGRVLDLSKPGTQAVYNAPCDGCANTSLRFVMNADTLMGLASSHAVSGTVFGMPCHLDREDLDAIRVFAFYIGVWK